MNIVGYKVVEYAEFEGKVTTLIEGGWQPWGSPIPFEGGRHVSQAMVRYAPIPTTDDKLTALLTEAIKLLSAEAQRHDRVVEALGAAHRRGHVTVELTELEQQDQATRTALVMTAAAMGVG